MASTKRPKLTKEDLKSPIAVQAKVQEVWTYIEHNWKKVLIAAASLAGLGLAVVGVQAWRASRSEGAASLFGRALETELTPLAGEPDAPDPAKRPNIPGHEPIPVFNDPGARARAALAVFQQVREKYAGNDIGDMAVLASADAHYDLAEWDLAIADFQAFLAAEPADPALRGLATEALGAAYENKGDVENARLTYEKLGSDVPENALLPDRRLYHLGRLAGRTGDAAKAREYYNKLKTDFPASPLVVDVNTRLTLLDNPGLLAAAAPSPGATAAPATPGSGAPAPAPAPVPASAAPAPATGAAPASAAPAPATGAAPAPAAPAPPASPAPGAPPPAPAPAPGAAG